MTTSGNRVSDGYEYSRSPKGDGWVLHEVVVKPDESYKVYKRATKKANGFPQPGTHANAPGIITPKTETYQGSAPAQQKTEPKPGLPPLSDWEKGIDGLKNYVDGVPREKIRGETSAILTELGDYGSGRSIPGGGPEQYARREQLKVALELFKERASKESIDPKDVPELGSYARNQLTTVFAASLSGAFIRRRGKGKSDKNCAC
ncbi:hypothetical protein KDK82_1301 [Delftia sp. K82]|uniref:hypothetical protein n=1 Tax=Delftia sp. K82 TaxID=1472718 RepID=UPI000B681472|nr:hypothetical protein [Delftia sp. K82]OWG17823.1 hypothetical protein KDK82_1301 [Delftia sp. K82]